MLAQVNIDPNELIDTTGVGWQEVIAAAIVVAISVIVASIVRRMVTRAIRKGPDIQPGMATFLGRFAGWMVMLLGVVIALMFLGFQTGPLLLMFAIVGLILVLSGRSILENFGAGVVLQVRSPFRVGEQVEVVGRVGTVKEINGRTVIIDTPDGREVHVPNGEVLANPIVNLSTRGHLRSEITVGVEYGTDLDLARSVVADAVRDIGGVLSDPAPDVFVAEFADSTINVKVRYWHEPTVREGFVVTDEVARAIDRAFRREHIVIAFPQRVMWQRRQDDV